MPAATASVIRLTTTSPTAMATMMTKTRRPRVRAAVETRGWAAGRSSWHATSEARGLALATAGRPPGLATRRRLPSVCCPPACVRSSSSAWRSAWLRTWASRSQPPGSRFSCASACSASAGPTTQQPGQARRGQLTDTRGEQLAAAGAQQALWLWQRRQAPQVRCCPSPAHLPGARTPSRRGMASSVVLRVGPARWARHGAWHVGPFSSVLPLELAWERHSGCVRGGAAPHTPPWAGAHRISGLGATLLACRGLTACARGPPEPACGPLLTVCPPFTQAKPRTRPGWTRPRRWMTCMTWSSGACAAKRP